MPKKGITGTVVSDKMEKTVVVEVEKKKRHPVYQKLVRKRKRFKARDELGAKQGDTVRIVESRPLSKEKKWKVVEIISNQHQII